MSNNDDLKKSHVEEMARHWKDDLGLFCRTVLPDLFYMPFSDNHQQILDLLDNRDLKKVGVCAHRGIGKTSILRGYILRAILEGSANFILYVSSSESSAVQQTENLKRELMTNRYLKALLGNAKPKKVDGMEETFGKNSWVAYGKTMVIPRGCGQQVRGQLFGTQRPDLVVFDDLETRDKLSTLEQRRKIQEWFFSDAKNVVSSLSDAKWRVLYIDTMKHHDSLMNRIMHLPDFHSVKIPICDENYKTLAPDHKSQDNLDSDLQEYRDMGLLDVFAQEFMCNPVAKEGATFTPSMFRYYDEGELPTGLVNVLIMDPARTTNTRSDDTGMVVWSIEPMSGKMYLRKAWGEKYTPDEMKRVALDTINKYKCSLLAIDSHGLHDHIMHPIKSFLNAHGCRIELMEVKSVRPKELTNSNLKGHETGKAMRVASLASYYRQNLIYHNRDHNQIAKYESQLLQFPSPDRWDVMDAAAYIVQILELGNIYISPEKEYDTIEERLEALMLEQAKDSTYMRAGPGGII